MSDSLEVRARKIALRCVRSCSPDAVISRLERFAGLIGDIYGVNLVIPTLRDNGHIKHFCSDLLEGKPHPWRESLRRLSSRGRLSVAASLFLFRKLVPSDPPSVESYISKMSTPSTEPDDDFVSFCVSMTRKMFRRGWDRSYIDKALSSTLPLTSCSEYGRKDGGARGFALSSPHRDRVDRVEFVSYILTAREKVQRCASKVIPVETGGKWRIISKPPLMDNALKPLHSSIYDHLSKEPWLLRGDAKPGRFKNFGSVDGEVFVSGDYESATDNLCTPVQRQILITILTQCENVPLGVREHAVDTLSSDLVGKDGIIRRQQRGQLMGELLSFPLLCLVNYLTFKWSISRDVPVFINGDDIVFRATPAEVSRWEAQVGKSGLVLSAGKTMKNSRFYSLNSTFFDSHDGSFVPFIRPKAIWSTKDRGCEQISSMHGRFYACQRGFFGERRRLVRAFFIQENRGSLLRSRRSATRGLGLKVDEGVLRGLDLWHRELFYLEQDTERPLPSKSFSETVCNDTPASWSRVSPHWYPEVQVKEWQKQFAAETICGAWENEVLKNAEAEAQWWRSHDEGCSPWSLSGVRTPKMLRMLKLTRSGFWRWYTCRRNRSVFGRCAFQRGRGVWKPDVPSLDDTVISPGGEEEAIEKVDYTRVGPPDCLL